MAVSLITPKPCIHSYSLLNVQGVQLHLDNQLTASYLIPCPTEQLSQAVLYNCNKPTNCLKYKLGHIISFLWDARDFKVDWYWVFWPKKCKRGKLRRKPEKTKQRKSAPWKQERIGIKLIVPVHSNMYKLQGQLRLYKTTLFLCFVFSSIKKAKEKKFKAFDNKCQVLSQMTYVFAHLTVHIIIQLSIYCFIHNIKINMSIQLFSLIQDA